jgi:methionine synthase II (cobalamin-independent)
VNKPVGVHLNGGVNLATTDDVLRTVATKLKGRIRRITDGEVDPDQRATNAAEPRRGARQQWIWFLTTAYEQAEGIEEIEPIELFGDEFPQFALSGEPEEVAFPKGLGYADAYEASYRRFLEFRGQGVIDKGVRFQAQFPTPMATAFWLRREDQERGLAPIAAALHKEIEDFIARVDPDDVAIQFDVAVEFGLLDGLYGPPAPLGAVAAGLAQSVNTVPSNVQVGLHLCYGDYRHRHLSVPESLETQVALANAVSAAAGRLVNWFAITVPQDEVRKSFFAPLAGLHLDPDTELYFGIVPYYPDRQAPGVTEAQIRLINSYVSSAHGTGRAPGQWGVCTECGMARVERQDVERLLDLHARIAAPIAEPATSVP